MTDRSSLQAFAISALRFVAGAMFTFHGAQKLFGVLGFPKLGMWSQLWFGGVIELVCGILIAIGLFTRPAALPQFLQGGAEDDRLDVPRELSLPEILDDLERQLILKAFAKAKGVKTETARLLGIKTSALYYKLEKYGFIQKGAAPDEG